MADLFDQRGQHDRIIEAATRHPGTTARQAVEYVRLLRAARQPWAKAELAACLAAGAQARLKLHLKRSRTIEASSRAGRTVDLATVVGVRRADGWHQVPLDLATPNELDDVIGREARRRSRITDRLDPLRRLLAIARSHPTATTVGQAVAAEGTSVPDVISGAWKAS